MIFFQRVARIMNYEAYIHPSSPGPWHCMVDQWRRFCFFFFSSFISLEHDYLVYIHGSIVTLDDMNN